MLREKTFNKWFNIFIITAMVTSMAVMTLIKFKASDSGHALHYEIGRASCRERV